MYGFLYFLESMSKSLCSKCGEKRPDSSINSAKDALKFALMKRIQKMAKAAGDLVEEKIAEKTTCENQSELHAQIDEPLT